MKIYGNLCQAVLPGCRMNLIVLILSEPKVATCTADEVIATQRRCYEERLLVSDFGYRLPVAGCWMQVAGCDTHYSLLTIYHSLLTTHFLWIPAVAFHSIVPCVAITSSFGSLMDIEAKIYMLTEKSTYKQLIIVITRLTITQLLITNCFIHLPAL